MSKEQGSGHIYKQLSTEMRNGLRDIYQHISSASDQESSNRANDLFLEASDQLDEVLKATESAAMNIMEILERQLDLQNEATTLIEDLVKGDASEDKKFRITEINKLLGDDLTTLMTTLSFQDIAGQRIKKVIAALGKIEKSVVELYVSSGLIMEGAEKDPAKDAKTLKDEASKAVEDFKNNRQVKSTLKGPSNDGISQNAIDDMLAQLGM